MACLWVAFWTGSAIRRLSPAGEVVSVVELPVSLVTSCAFGGDDLSDLYVTSARMGLTDAELEREPHAGGIFRVSPGVRGPAAHRFESLARDSSDPPIVGTISCSTTI